MRYFTRLAYVWPACWLWDHCRVMDYPSTALVADRLRPAGDSATATRMGCEAQAVGTPHAAYAAPTPTCRPSAVGPVRAPTPS